MQVEFLRKTAGGDLIPASSRELGVLDVKSKVATHSQLLSTASAAEKLQWALEMKDYANGLYSEQRYEEAMDKYVEALTASDFGTCSKPVSSSSSDTTPIDESLDIVEDSGDGGWAMVDSPSRRFKDLSKTGSSASAYHDGNIDNLVMPILTNLCACCIQLKLFGKAIAFANQGLQLRPKHCKALMRRGIAYLSTGEYSDAIADFNRALELNSGPTTLDVESSRESSSNITCISSVQTGNNSLSSADIERMKIFLIKARAGKEADRLSEQKVRKRVEESFKKRAYINDFSASKQLILEDSITPDEKKKEEEPSKGREWLDLKMVVASIFICVFAVCYVIMME